jgi:lysophospholipase L1-like esterase
MKDTPVGSTRIRLPPSSSTFPSFSRRRSDVNRSSSPLAATTKLSLPNRETLESVIDHSSVSDRPIVVAALGDSITEGSPGLRGWDVWAVRADGRYEIRNCGIYGQRTDEIAARLDACARGADVLVVQGGINDIAQGSDIRTAAANLRAMVVRGKELVPRVALADVLPWNNGWPDAEPKITRLNELIAAIARDEQVPLLSFHDTLEDADRPGRMRDEWTHEGDHPNEAGYRLLAEVVLRALGSDPAGV